MIELLRVHGADRAPHAGGRTLLDHLVGTQAILRRWQAPASVQCAALIHSVYGTDAYAPAVVPLSARGEVAAAAGETAERLAYLFCMTPRGPLLAGTRHWSPDLPLRATDADGSADAGTGGGPPASPPTRPELDALVLLHMANLAEQARAADGSPGRWVARCAELAQLLGAGAVAAPAFVDHLTGFSEQDEALARRAYREAARTLDDPAARTNRWALAAAACPVAAEPCVWLAHAARAVADDTTARAWLAEARSRLLALGTAWDKRLSYEEWLALIDSLDASGDAGEPPAADVSGPRQLLASVIDARAGEAPSRVRRPASGAVARARFQKYVEALAATAGDRTRVPYPDLPSRPWYEPEAFPLVGYLEANVAAIRAEVLSLDGARFQRESERIGRSGEWDVVFLYERGRRHDDVCAACPATMQGIEAYPTMRNAAGLIYVSRMRGGTHIAPHRGPTNMRLRCHLGIAVPEGDCGIRVGTETRRWQQGRCLVFDDSYEHEAWNHTHEDRIVLIVDLWHPELSPDEVTLLEGLHDYMSAYARRLARYWSTNAANAQR